jgi:hypothetical protein
VAADILGPQHQDLFSIRWNALVRLRSIAQQDTGKQVKSHAFKSQNIGTQFESCVLATRFMEIKSVTAYLACDPAYTKW